MGGEIRNEAVEGVCVCEGVRCVRVCVGGGFTSLLFGCQQERVTLDVFNGVCKED